MADVLILTPFFSPNVGGVETHLDDLVDVLKNKNFKSYVLTYQPLMLKVKAPGLEKKGNTEIHRIEWIRSLFYKVEPYPVLDFLYLTPRLLWAAFFFLLFHPQVKVIHAQGINAAFIAVLLKHFFRTRVIISTHALYEFNNESLFSKITRWTFNRADKILSLLNRSRQELIKLGVSAEKIEPYYHWVDQNIFIPGNKLTAKSSIQWEVHQTHVLFIGRVFEKKGINELIETAQLLHKNDYHDVTIHIIGTGPLEELVKTAAQKNPCLDFIGRVNNLNLPEYLQAADIFIIPSTHEEGAGRVIMEALSCGTPVIGANRGGIPEVMDSSVGELITVTPDEIIKAITKITKRIESKDITTEKCRHYAEQKFSSHNAEQIIAAYQG